MSRTRDQLMHQFQALDRELQELEASDAADEALWLAFERVANMPTHLVSQQDRLWWWGQLYQTMDRHALRRLVGRVSQSAS